MSVPNQFPLIDDSRRLAIIGEAPGAKEDECGIPFSGPSGQMLDRLLQKVNMPRSACFVGNVTQERPPNNQIHQFDWHGWEIQSGLKQLGEDLGKFKPNCCLLLGNTAIKAAGQVHSITELRGSIFKPDDVDSAFFQRKCVASVHPAMVLRDYSNHPFLAADIKRAVVESSNPAMNLPERHAIINLSPIEVIDRLNSLQEGRRVSIDIEGGIVTKQGKPTNVSVIGIAARWDCAFTINWLKFSLEEKAMVYPHLKKFLGNPRIPKVLQNSVYDNFVLTYLYRMPIHGVVDDTLMSGWELFPEFPKSLAFQTSIMTRTPFYKYLGKDENYAIHCEYCALDCMVTLEISDKHRKMLTGPALAHYEHNIRLLHPIMFMELRGIKTDQEQVKTELEQTKRTLAVLQARVDALIGLPSGESLNMNSPAQMNQMLYKRIGYAPQYQMENGRKTNKLTADVNALLKLLRDYSGDPLILNIMHWRKADGIRKQLEITPDEDNRARATFTIPGTETGRMSAKESPTGNGGNLQTITKSLRHIYVADEGFTMSQSDLAGADGWTVACYAKKVGDGTMLQDYRLGIKPARFVALAHLGDAIALAKMSSEELAAYVEAHKKEIPAWLYFTCKRVQHGTNYLLGEQTMSQQILKDSWNETRDPIYVSPRDCKTLQKIYRSRYPGVEAWQNWAKNELESKRKLTTPSGNTRQFMGRPYDHATLREFLAHEPQSNTSCVTNQAIERLWADPENRDPITNAPIIEPLLQVHDAMITQFPSHLADWAKPKIESYFNIPITIAGTTLTIAVETNYGPNWGSLK